MSRNRRGKIALFLGVFLIIPLMACEDSETIPPANSTITVAGNPATIVTGSQGGVGNSDIIATVRNELGVPLPGQSVRFSATAGKLVFVGSDLSDPNAPSAANIPIDTDSLGNSSVTLVTNTTTTVTATAGNATGTLTLNTTIAAVNSVTLNFDDAGIGCENPTNLDSCSDKVCLLAEARSINGIPIPRAQMRFELRNAVNTGNSSTTWAGTFQPTDDFTDDNGVLESEFSPTDTCNTPCPSGETCTGEIVAISGSVESVPITVTLKR